MSPQGKPVSICDALIMSKQILRRFWVTERYRYQIVSESSKKFMDLNIGVQGNLSFERLFVPLFTCCLPLLEKNFLSKYRSRWRTVFVKWLTGKRRLVLFPSGTIVRDFYQHVASRISLLNDVCNSDNDYTTAQLKRILS